MKCDYEMKPNQYKGVEYDPCKNCNGLWFDAGEFKDFCEETFMDRIKDWKARKR